MFAFLCNIDEEIPMRAFGTPQSHIADHALEETAQQFSVLGRECKRIPCWQLQGLCWWTDLDPARLSLACFYSAQDSISHIRRGLLTKGPNKTTQERLVSRSCQNAQMSNLSALNFTKGPINCQDVRFRAARYRIEAQAAMVFHICPAIGIH